MAGKYRGKPKAAFLTLVTATHGSITFASAVERVTVSASADCTLTWKEGQTTDPGSVPASGTAVDDRGVRRLIAGEKEEIAFSVPSTMVAFKQSSGASVDLTIEGLLGSPR